MLAAGSVAHAAFPLAANGRILFDRSAGGESDLYLMNADGSGQVNLTNTPGSSEFFGKLFPDARQIIFTRFEGGQEDIYVANADGTGQVNLTKTPAPLDELVNGVSPDGRLILFSRFDATRRIST
jgi:TolB protein